MVTCICPTRGRGRFIHRAIDCFLAQTWPESERELLILDEEFNPSLAGDPRLPGVRYERLMANPTIGAKRNLCCSKARGRIIAHWDDDDWSAPGRLADQVTRLVETGAPVTGYHTMEFRAEDGRRWLYSNPQRNYAVGTSLCYLRAWWETHRFNDQNVGEDHSFVRMAPGLVAVAAGDLMWASVHSQNTSERALGTRQWRRIA